MKRRLAMIVFIVFAATECPATQYRFQRLHDIAKALSVVPTASDQPYMVVDSVCSFNGKVVRMKTNVFGEVSHIGYRLFNNVLVDLQKDNVQVLDFVERYLLELDLMLDGRPPAERMKLDKVTLVSGSLDMLRNISASFSFTIEEIPRRMFRMTWQIGQEEVCVAFPADCQLILGASIIELEKVALDDIMQRLSLTTDELIPGYDISGARLSGNMHVIDGGYFVSEYIKGDVFLTGNSGNYELLDTPDIPDKSISNIMVTGLYKREIPTTLVMHRYAHEKDTLSISLQQYITFCKGEGCKMYFGIRSVMKDRMNCTVIAFNEKLGYNHLLTVEFPLGILSGTDEMVRASAYLYIPLHDVSEDFFNQFKNKQ